MLRSSPTLQVVDSEVSKRMKTLGAVEAFQDKSIKLNRDHLFILFQTLTKAKSTLLILMSVFLSKVNYFLII